MLRSTVVCAVQPQSTPRAVHLSDRRCSCRTHRAVARRSEGPRMRDVFHDELDEIGAGVLEMTRLVEVAMDQATGALLDADLHRAEPVIEADAKIDDPRADLAD